MPGLGPVDFALSIFYSVLFIALVVLSYVVLRDKVRR